MTITVTASAGVNSATLPSHSTGDIIVIFAYRDGFNTPPALPIGFSSLASFGANANSLTAGFKTALNSSESSGTWTNATGLVAFVIKGSGDPIGIGAGGSGGTVNSSNSYPNVDFPDLSLFRIDGSSKVIAFVGHRNINTDLNNAPSGMTNLVNTLGNGTCEIAGHVTSGTVSSFTGKSADISNGSSSAGFYLSFSLEITEDITPPPPDPGDGGGGGVPPDPEPATVSVLSEIFPENPMAEEWEWKTDVITSMDAHEENRIGLRISPRISLGYNSLVLSETQRRENYLRLFQEVQTTKLVPYFQYTTRLTSARTTGQTRIFFNPAMSDIREGDSFLIYDRSLKSSVLYEAGNLQIDGCMVVGGLVTDHDMGSFVVPVHASYIQDGAGFSMRNISGSLEFMTNQSFTREEFVRPDTAPEIRYHYSKPVFSRRTTIEGSVDEKFNMLNKFVDNEIGVFEVVRYRQYPTIFGKIKFKVDRIRQPDEMDYWRSLFDLIKGQRGAFYIPTWRRDFVLRTAPDGTNIVVFENNGFIDNYQGKPEFEHLQFMTADGVVAYRKIVSAYVTGDDLVVTLNSDLPNTARFKKSTLICSFLLLSRLNSDKVTLQHFSQYTLISADTRTIRA